MQTNVVDKLKSIQIIGILSGLRETLWYYWQMSS